MVLPLVDEDDPKCFLCHAGFSSIEDLRKHHLEAHPGSSEERHRQEPAPGDVSVF